MSDDDDRSAQSVAKGIGGVLVAVIAVNVLLRVVPLPDIDLPSVALPDLPAWGDTVVDWVHTTVKVKNWLLIAVVAVILAGVAIDRRDKRRDCDRTGAGDGDGNR